MENQPEISVVVTLHNEEGNAEPLYSAAKDALEKLGRSYEMIFVNDASMDRTGEVLERIKKSDPSFHYCELAENVGENWARLAGISKAKGKIIVTMDGDFQNDPADIPLVLSELEKGYKAVSGWRRERVGGWFDRILPSVVANGIISLVSGVRVHDCGCSLKAYRREVVEGKFFPKGYVNRFAPVIFGLKPREFSEVAVKDRMRSWGRSHYGLERIFIVLNDALAFPFAVRGPERMKKLVTFLAAFFALLALFSTAAAFFGDYPAWPTAILSGLLAAFLSIRWNLARFIDAKNSPKFKIKRFI